MFPKYDLAKFNTFDFVEAIFGMIFGDMLIYMLIL